MSAFDYRPLTTDQRPIADGNLHGRNKMEEMKRNADPGGGKLAYVERWILYCNCGRPNQYLDGTVFEFVVHKHFVNV
ncbi:hypothetical protein J6590_061510 [Homalodisca vitripennis]|nr:hypothetical protein J6590_061510 [Homalodisca vitripennis]